MPETYEAADGITGVDTRMGGKASITSAYLLHGAQPTLVETGPTTSAEAVTAGLESIGLNGADLAHIVVTHIHLDHAGGVGTLARAFPAATVWVHERGVHHLADPTKLVASATRVYGEERLHRLFGSVEPVPADRLRSIGDRDRIDLGERFLDVLYTPGHASHHVALIDSRSGAVFTGDALGIHLPDDRVLRPATPPPDIDVEVGLESIERIRSHARTVLLFSHFGPVTEVDELCAIAASRLQKWADIVREGIMGGIESVEGLSHLLERRTASEFDGVDSVDPTRYDLLSDMEMNAAGLARYWAKKPGGLDSA
jgi:glyoxylase-like metal-dependent hydrolase (beta-lactamase superfamily II)